MRRGERKSSIVENEKRSRLLATLAIPWRLLTLPDPPSHPVANEAGTSSSSQPLSGTPSPWVQEMRREERTKLMLKELVSRGRDDERGKTKAHGSVAYGLHQLFASRAVPEEPHARAVDINARVGGGGEAGGQEEEEEAGPSNRPPTQPPSRTPLPSSWRSGAMDLHLSLPSGPLGSENVLFMKELADSWPIEHELDDLIEGAMARSNDIGIKMKVRWSREESAPLNPPADIPQQSPRLLFTSSEPKRPLKRAKRRRAGEIEP